MAIALSTSETQFSTWLCERLKSANNSAADLDTSEHIFIDYILTALSDEENSDEDKRESIIPILQELNQNDSFKEETLANEIIAKWNEFKQQDDQKESVKEEDTPTETILSMINKHKTQLVQKSTRKSDADIGAQASNENTHRTHETYYEESDSDEGETNDNLLTNTNVQDAIARDKQIKDKIAEKHVKQKEQTKKALEEQKQREIEKKKKAQQKVAKVERKR